MRARQFIILREYSREKTANVFGNKLIAALAKDKSYGLQGTELGKSRAFLDQKTKINDPITDEQRQMILDQIMQYLENADPTTNKEYMQWLAKVYANQGVKLEDISTRGNSALRQYHLYKFDKILPPELRDIGRLTFADLEGVYSNAELRQAYNAKQEQDRAKTTPRGDAETVFENDKVRVVHPKDQEAACYYGQGTRWCTASTGSSNYFDSYNRSGPMYILLPKQPKYEGEKYQLHFESGQFMDEGDNQVDSIVDLLAGRFGDDLVEFFMRVEPQIKDWLAFAPDEVLEPLLNKIKQAVNDHVSEMVNEWEVNDDYWYEYLRDQGHVYPEGHEEEGQIDWEAVSDANESYTSWNYEASDFISDINSAVDLTPQEVRGLADEASREWGADTSTVDDLDKVIIYNIEENFRNRDSDGGIVEWIAEHIYIKRTGGGGDGAWDVSLLYTQKDGTRKEYPINT